MQFCFNFGFLSHPFTVLKKTDDKPALEITLEGKKDLEEKVQLFKRCVIHNQVEISCTLLIWCTLMRKTSFTHCSIKKPKCHSVFNQKSEKFPLRKILEDELAL
jgi:hypothetical protein